ncbi:MAG: hypothetical protein ABIQ49_14075 [Gemmatimonadales bacterium]
MNDAWTPFLTVILYALLPAAAAVGAAAAAAVFPPGAQVRSMIQHLAAGVVFAVLGIRAGARRLEGAGNLGVLVPVGIDFVVNGSG